MRVLFVTIPEKSHLYGLAPLAWAMRAAGHEVRVASTAEFADAIVRTGMTAVAVGRNEGITAGMSGIRAAQEHGAVDWSELDPAKVTWAEETDRAQMGAYGYAMYSEPMMDELVAFARDWRPDLVVWDTLAYAGPVAAAASGAAHARALTSSVDVWVAKRRLLRKLNEEVPADERRDPLRAWLDGRSEDFGGRFSEEFVTGQLAVDPLPDSLAVPTDIRRVPMRFVPYNGPAVVPDWLRTPPERPRICLSLGASNTERYGGDYVSTADILAALAELDAEVVAALLPAQARELGTLPPNVRAEPVPLAALLPTCAALVHHGGFGNYGNALVNGVPQVMVSTAMSDHLYRGEDLVRHGAGVLLRHHEANPDVVCDAVSRLLSDAAFRDNANRLRDEALALPAPTEVVPVLERLAAERRTAPWRG